MSNRHWLAVIALAGAVIALAAPSYLHRLAPAGIAVRYPEGTVHGFLELRTESGALLAHGDLTQIVKDGAIDSHMIFHFADSATLFEETVRFTQAGAFAIESYHLIQRGSVFPFAIDASLARDGHYIVKTTSKAKNAVETQYAGKLDLPADVANGLVITLAKNIAPRETASVHIVAFTPEPRVIGLEIAPSGTHDAMLGGHVERTTEFVLTPKLGAALHFFASLAGKAPPESHAWIIADDVPAFIRFEGPMYDGPVFRLTPASPTWPAGEGSATH